MLPMRRLLVATIALGVACGSSGGGTSVPAGTEGGHCYGDGTCNPGLDCRSNLCVNLGTVAAGGTFGAGGALSVDGSLGAAGATSAGGVIGLDGAADGPIGTGGATSSGGVVGFDGAAETSTPSLAIDAGSACQALGDSCGGAAACCPGTTCYSNGTATFCAATCSDSAACSGGCCAPLNNGSNVCLAGASCVCARPGDDCSTKGCCAGALCVGDGTNFRCASACTDSSQCVGGCCATLASGKKACGPAANCAPTSACAKPNESCAASACCSGSVCVNDGTPARCAATCTSSSECVSGCCASLVSGQKACAPTANCNTAGSLCTNFATCLNTPTDLNPAPSFSSCSISHFDGEQCKWCVAYLGVTTAQVLPCLSGSLWCRDWSSSVTGCQRTLASQGLGGSSYEQTQIGEFPNFCQ